MLLCMNYSSRGCIEIGEGGVEVSNTGIERRAPEIARMMRRLFRNGSFLISMMAQSENCRDGRGSRRGGHSRTFRLRRMTTTLFLAVIWCSSALAQVEAGQTVASIPVKDGELLVQNGTNNDVWLVADDERISINAEEALRVAAWIKEGKMGDYGNIGSVAFRREADILVVTFAPEKTGKRELRLEDAEAMQLAAGLASVRQNVSEAGQ